MADFPPRHCDLMKPGMGYSGVVRVLYTVTATNLYQVRSTNLLVA